MAPPRKVSLIRTTSGCLVWQGAVTPDGYGKCCRRVGGVKYHLAHRWAWAEEYGDIPDGMLVCHTCDNPPCCNPEHMFLGTDEDNARDRAAKGRSGPRPGNRNGKLTSDQIASILSQYSCGVSQRDIGSSFGVTQPTISYHVRKFMVDNR